MAAIEVNIIEPVTNALATEAGWIGLLLGLLGRQVWGYLKSLRGALTNRRAD